MIPTSRVGDVCTGHGCFGGRPIAAGAGTVFANGIPVARQGDPMAPHCCVHRDQLIYTSTGGYKRIKTLRDEFVQGKINYTKSQCPISKEVVNSQIVAVYQTKQVVEYYEIKLENGKTVKVTGDHEFLLESGKYRKAEDLRLDDELAEIK